MIVIRLVVHIWNIRRVTAASDGSTGLHTAAATVVTMLIESYALYAAALLLYIVPWAVSSWVSIVFSKPLGMVQVRTVSTFPLSATMLGHCSIAITRRSSLHI